MLQHLLACKAFVFQSVIISNLLFDHSNGLHRRKKDAVLPWSLKYTALAMKKNPEIMYGMLQWKHKKHFLSCLLSPSHLLHLTQDGEWEATRIQKEMLLFYLYLLEQITIERTFFRAGVCSFIYSLALKGMQIS